MESFLSSSNAFGRSSQDIGEHSLLTVVTAQPSFIGERIDVSGLVKKKPHFFLPAPPKLSETGHFCSWKEIFFQGELSKLIPAGKDCFNWSAFVNSHF